ncbi:SCO7613 C-terminal domain-containing membrane protein [Micromonospora sp. NPDC007230]|uniref:SCO7613 C-terminal domain-containing membrane protein n=1 Tax=Micromonospora sp. NPDC007230 TaxID=3364237 RepID=UPI0036B566C5
MENTGYPCPGCGAPADLASGCPGCGRPPYPPAAEVVRLDREIAALTPQVERARVAYQELATRLGAARQHRAELAARIRREIPAPRPVGPLPPLPAPPAVPVRPGGAETSTRTVQGLLFVLGGLLLGTAAVVFTAVAWATFGVAGRAVILLGCTALALAAPLVARRRGLRGTAETFAAVGLLLVLLDGYAAWSVDLLGVAGWPGSRYPALVGGIGAAVAAGYARLSRLTVPWFAALLTAQPVLPLAAVAAEPSAAGWALVFTGVALGDLVVVIALRNRVPRAHVALPSDGATSASGGDPGRGGVAGGGPVHFGPHGEAAAGGGPAAAPTGVVAPGAVPPGPAPAGPRVGPRSVPVPAGGSAAVAAGWALGWIGHGVALAVAAGCALIPLGLGRVAGTPLLAGGPLLVVALALLTGALAAGGRTYRAIAAGLLVPVLATVLIRPVAALHPGLLLVAAGLLAAGLAGAVRAVPQRLRTGPRVGALVVAAGAGQVTTILTGLVAGAGVLAAFPAWQGAEPVPAPSWGWQLPVAVLLTAGAVVLLVPPSARPVVGAVGGALAVLAGPAAVATPWPLVVTLDLVAATALLLGAVYRPRRRYPTVLVPALAAAVLLGHALLVGCADPAGAGTVFAVLAIVGVAGAARGRRGEGAQPTVAGVALGGALLAVPAAVAVALLGFGAAPWWRLRGASGAVVLLVVAVLAVRRHWPDLHGYASAGFAVALASVGVAPLVVPGAERVSFYAAAGVLLAVAAGGAARPAVAPRVVGAGLAGLALLAAAPAVLRVLLELPVRPWSGVPASGPVPGAVPAGLALLLLGTAAAAYARAATAPDRGAGPDRPSFGPERRLAARRPNYGRQPSRSPSGGRRLPTLAALPFGAVALPVLLAATGAPWPVVPALTFGAGLATLLVAALAAPRWALLPVTVPLGLALTVPGLGGLLATRAGTLAGLGALVVAAAVVGAVGRADGIQLAGRLSALAAATGFAVTASLAGGLPLRTAAFAVLAVAAAALHAGPLLRPATATPRAALAVEVAAHAVALLALLLTTGALRHAAAVCALWGAVVAVRVLRRDEPAGRRWVLAGVAGGSELLGGWLLLAAGGVAVLEAYTVPAAALALGAGLVALRTRPGLNSWLALGPGLAAALLPSLVSVLAAPDPQPWRRLALGVVALGVVLGGAVRRWQAPVVLGAVTLVPLALHELARGWDLLPRWIYLGLGGLALIALAATYERRRRDLARLRAVVGRMG